jgi:1-acyl-sn-glycerol-3-phosphate acyltransferase
LRRVGEVLRSTGFYVAFYGGTLLFLAAGLLALPFGSRRAMQGVAAAWTRWHRRCVTRLLGIRIVVSGELPREGALVAMKHESFFEALDLGVLFDSPVIFAKAELLRIPVWGTVASACGLVPVEREQGAKALRTMVAAARARARDGRVFAIFPEGTRVPHGTEPKLRSGFAALYKLLALPVVPIAVDSGPLYQRRWKRRGTITYRVGEPIPPGLPREEVEARVQAAINALNG